MHKLTITQEQRPEAKQMPLIRPEHYGEVDNAPVEVRLRAKLREYEGLLEEAMDLPDHAPTGNLFEGASAFGLNRKEMIAMLRSKIADLRRLANQYSERK